ncbi:hypothetical protein MBANPS3_005514 [Mucor bainieri]
MLQVSQALPAADNTPMERDGLPLVGDVLKIPYGTRSKTQDTLLQRVVYVLRKFRLPDGTIVTKRVKKILRPSKEQKEEYVTRVITDPSGGPLKEQEESSEEEKGWVAMPPPSSA